MNIRQEIILKRLVHTYQDKLDDVLEDYSLICAILGLIKNYGAPEDEDTIKHLQRRKIKITDKMKDIQECLDMAQKELKALKEEVN